MTEGIILMSPVFLYLVGMSLNPKTTSKTAFYRTISDFYFWLNPLKEFIQALKSALGGRFDFKVITQIELGENLLFLSEYHL